MSYNRPDRRYYFWKVPDASADDGAFSITPPTGKSVARLVDWLLECTTDMAGAGGAIAIGNTTSDIAYLVNGFATNPLEARDISTIADYNANATWAIGSDQTMSWDFPVIDTGLEGDSTIVVTPCRGATSGALNVIFTFDWY